MNYKKIVILFLFWGSLSIPAIAQLQSETPLHLMNYDYIRRWRFGFSIGGNVFDYAISNSNKVVQPFGDALPTTMWAEVVDVKPGFNINGIINYRLSRHFDLRTLPGICFGTRDLNFYRSDGSLERSMELESNYVEIPILLKYSAFRSSNYRPYLVGGINTRFNMNWKTREQKGTYISTAICEPFYELGVGFDVYFYYFKLSFEFKYSGGFLNALGNSTVEGYGYYKDVIDRLNSQIFIFAIHIE